MREKQTMSVDGNWTIAMETPLGTRHASLALTAEGSTLSGTMSGEAGTTAIANGRVSGNDIAFTVDITQPMTMTLEFSAKVAGDAMTGSVKLGMFGNAPLAGKRG
jgi:hypothetical protein